MDAPSPPPTPNPFQVAAAQSQANISTAVATAILANADEDTPQATTTMTQTGTYELADPQYNSTGVQVGTTTRYIPKFTKTITLKTSSATIFDKQQSLKTAMLTLGNLQAGGMTTLLGTPYNLTSLPTAAASPSAPTLTQNIDLSGVPALITDVDDTTLEAARQTVIDAINDRLQWQIDLDRSAKITALANQGIYPGMRAYERAMREFDYQSNDARKQAILIAGQEQARIFQIAAGKAEFRNRANAQAFSQASIKLQTYNGSLTQQFQLLRAVADFANTFRERTLQEELIVRNQAVNESLALLHGGQMSLPTMTPYRGATVDSTPLGQYIYQSAQMDMSKWQAQVQRQDAMIGGIAGIVGGVASMGVASGGTVGGNLMSKMMQ